MMHVNVMRDQIKKLVWHTYILTIFDEGYKYLKEIKLFTSLAEISTRISSFITIYFVRVKTRNKSQTSLT